MAFESFDDLARVGLKRAAMKAARVVVKSEFSERQRPQTVFRFSDDLVERAGCVPSEDRIELMIDRTDMAIRARKVAAGGYKLIGNCSARPYLKFGSARHAYRRRGSRSDGCRCRRWRADVCSAGRRAACSQLSSATANRPSWK
jgi:hypothetical protein